MTFTDQQRAVIEALDMSPEDLRGLAGALQRDHRIVSVREVAETQLATLPRHHRYSKSLDRLICWAGEDDAATVSAADVAGWALRSGAEARADPKARHGVGAEEAMVLATRAAYARAIDAGLVRHNPATGVTLPDRPPSRRTALSADQLEQSHLALLTHSRDPDLDDLVFGFLRETGCRRHGAIRLSQDDLAPATRAVRLIEKYGKQRWIPVSAHLVGRLVSHASRTPQRLPARPASTRRRPSQRQMVRGLRSAHPTPGMGGRARRQRPLDPPHNDHRHRTHRRRRGWRRPTPATPTATSESRGHTPKPLLTSCGLPMPGSFSIDVESADDPGVPPNLLRRAVPTRGHPIDFVGPNPASAH